MGFVKVSKNELRHGTHENLIGMPVMLSSEELQKGAVDVFKESTFTNKVQQQFKSKESFLPLIIEKNEQFEINKDGKIKESQLIGKVFIKNSGIGDKIWDIKVNIHDPSSDMKIGKQYIIQELNPHEEWSQEFTFDAPSEPPLKIIENVSNVTFDMERSTRVSPILLKNVQNHLFFTIIVENTNPNDIHNLEIFKRLPDTVQKIVECKTESGHMEYDRGHIAWRIDLLPHGQKVALTCKAAVETKPTTSGKIQVRYAIREKFEDFFVESLTGLTRMGDFLSIKEKDMKPGVWDCEVSFLNRSEFSIQISNYEVKLNASDNTSFVNLREPLRLNPGEKHDFPKWELESATRPAFYKHMDYSVLPDIIYTRAGRFQIEEVGVNVFDVEARKEFSQTTFPSFKEGSLDCTIKLKNSSTVPLNHFYIQDTISKHFIPPAKETIQVLIDGEHLEWQEISTDTRYKKLVANKSELANQINTVDSQIKDLQNKLGRVRKDQAKVDSKDLDAQVSKANSALEKGNQSLSQSNAQKEGLLKKIAEKEGLIAKLKKDLDAINKELIKTKELQDISSTIAKETELGNKLSQEVNTVKQDIQTKEKGLSDGKNSLANVTKSLATLTSKQEECKKTEDQTSTEFEDVKQKFKIDKSNQALAEKQKTLKTKLGELKKEQAQIKKDIAKFISQISESEATLRTMEGELVTLREKQQVLQKQVDEKGEKIKSLLESAKNIPNPEALSAKVGELDAKITDLNNKNNTAASEIKDLNKKISTIDQEIGKFKKEKDAQERIKNELTQKLQSGSDLQSQNAKIQAEIATQEKKSKELQDKINELETGISRISDSSVNSKKLDESFDNLCMDPEFCGVKARILPDNEDYGSSHELHFSLINLEKISKPVGIGQTLEIRFPLRIVGLNPNLQNEYMFPTVITCNSIPLATPYKFNIGAENLPSIEIEHKRQRISLGRIVDHYAEAGKFDITLIVKNDSNTVLNDLEIVDTIPKGAELANAEYPFVIEGHLNPELSKVVWKLEKISAYQEIEISYLLSLPSGESYNLNNMDLSLK